MSATELAREVIGRLINRGVTEIVIAPGSRNAPLSFAAYAAAQQGLVRLHTRFDERSAGFLALGLTKVGARAAVICTSGTAAANLTPAATEAAHAGVPVVFVTADRPASLRGTNSNQTTEHRGLLGPLVSMADVSQPPDLERLHPDSNEPAHLNVHLSPPLVPDSLDDWAPETAVRADIPSHQPAPCSLALGPRTVVVAGDDAGPPPRVLAQAANWPLFAEPTSGCRTGPNALRTYRLLLDGALGHSIERVIVAGRPTLSRPITALLQRENVEVISMQARGCWTRRPFEVAAEYADLTVDGADDPTWLDQWREVDRSVGRGIDQLLGNETDITPHEVAGVVARAVPPSGLLFVGASNPVRDLDLMITGYRVGDRRKLIANRGLAGIDGTVSSAIGAALGRPHSTRALAVMGDVTFLHDAGALLLGPDQPRPDLTIVVVNDNGGSIFANLEQGAEPYADAYEPLFGSPHHADLAALCAASRTPYLQVGSVPELEQALMSPAGGIEVIEVAVRRDNRRELETRIREIAR